MVWCDQFTDEVRNWPNTDGAQSCRRAVGLRIAQRLGEHVEGRDRRTNSPTHFDTVHSPHFPPATDRDLEDGEFSVNTTLSILQHVQHFTNTGFIFRTVSSYFFKQLPVIFLRAPIPNKVIFTGYLF